MKKLLLLSTISLLILSCKSASTTKSANAKETTSVENSEEDDMTVYFKATGNEPFWGIKFWKDKVIFTSLTEGKEKLVFSYAEPIKAMDANVKMYRLRNATATTTVTIQQLDCQDSMSGEMSPYKVFVEIKNNSGIDLENLEGCGKYITDYRLHDIWVLEKLNGSKVVLTDFQKEFPRIEINSYDNTFQGFGGCNSLSGRIFYEKDLLRFTDVVSTMMACLPGNKEGEFVTALQNTTTYSIGNNRLMLSNPSGELVVFRKVD